MTELVRLSNVSKWVGEEQTRTSILSDVNLTIAAGDYLAVMGASGSGKSTLLNLIGLLDTPSSGAVYFHDKNASILGDDDAAELRLKTIGFIFQSFNLLSYLTAQENVELPIGYARTSDAESRSRHLLQKMNLEHRLSAYPATLSGGERQRVAIARALANSPSLILADEPTGALDSKTGVEVMDLIGELNAAGAAVVMVTHDEKIARRARRVIRMADGRILG